MPIYTFRNRVTGEVFDHTLKMSEYDAYIEMNPDVERYYGNGTNVGFKFIDGMFRPGGDRRFEENVIDRIKRSVPGNTVKDYHKTSQNRL